MSWGTCYKGTNNIHAGFPALMSDGSWGRDWEPACANNNQLKKSAGISNNYQYRQYLMQNADAIIKKNQTNACENCCTCWKNFEDRNKVKCPEKHIYKSTEDNIQPFGYENSDLKNTYVTSQSLQSRLVAPIITQAQMLSMPNFN
jgi:hypothetical protein